MQGNTKWFHFIKQSEIFLLLTLSFLLKKLDLIMAAPNFKSSNLVNWNKNSFWFLCLFTLLTLDKKYYKNWTKETVFVYILGFIFFLAFLAQKLIYTINIWFNFAFGSFFEQNHLLNLFILRVYAKRWPKCARISLQKLMWPKIRSINLFLTDYQKTFP